MSGSRARSERYGQRRALTASEALSSRHEPLADGTDWRRTNAASDEDAVDRTEVLESVFANPDLYRLADTLPPPDPTKPCRPRDYPHWAMLAYGFLVPVYRSHRNVSTALRIRKTWADVLDAVARTAGPDAVADLRPIAQVVGPTRNHYNYWFKHHKHLVQKIIDEYTPMAVQQAIEQGLLSPDTAVFHACPDQRNTLYGDGKVMTGPLRYRPRTKNASRSDAPLKRVDSASAFWKEGGDGGQNVAGTKIVATSVRGPGYLNRVCLTLDIQVKGGRTEADIAVDQIAKIKRLAGSGVHAAAWDGALSHTHINKIMAELGLVVLSPVKAKSNPEKVRSGTKSKTRVEKEHFVESLNYRTPHGYCEHSLYARGGRIGQKTHLADGTARWEPLPITKIEHGGGKKRHRWYHVVTVPCDTNGDHQHRIPLVQSDDDTRKGFLRSEYLRQVPPDTKGYERAYGTRPAAESDNAQRESCFTWQRLPAYGPDGQLLVMLGWNFLENSKARYVHHRRLRAQDDAA